MIVDDSRLPADAVHTRIVEVDGIPMSARLLEVPRPRAVIVALHGGATSSAYFDCPGHPELSLLRAAAAAGFTTLALDRPGYGSSRPFAKGFDDPQRRADIMYTAIDRHLGARSRGAGIFLVAHSAGCQLALRMAGGQQGTQLLGLELSGSGRRRHPEAEALLSSGGFTGPQVAELLWQPARLYPPDLVGGAPITSGGPRYEGALMADWADVHFPALAAEVRIPVRYTVGDHEAVWRNTPADLADIAALFTRALRLVLNIQPDSGHNLSVGHTAPAYHRELLSFIGDCADFQQAGELGVPTA